MAETNPEKHLYELLRGFDTAMVVTRSTDGAMHARPMAVVELRASADAYFVTSIDSPKMSEIDADATVTLTFQDSSRYAYVAGRVAVVRDRALIDKFWKPAWKVWFPKGRDDPAITLLKFDAAYGQYWDNTWTQGLKYLFRAAKAYMNDETPATDERQNAKVSL